MLILIFAYMHKVIDMEALSLSNEIYKLHADMCSALADPRRILILYYLSEEPHIVTSLAQELGMSQPAVSRHLKVLRERGLVNAERSGTSVMYNLADTRIIEALDLLRSIMRDRISYRAGILESEYGSL
jgi:DNA-binding transcriptional ArsR family regulator